MEQRQAVRISVQLRARLLRNDERDELESPEHLEPPGRSEPAQGWYDGSPHEAAPRVAHRRQSRRSHTESGIVCSCARSTSGAHVPSHHGRAANAEESGPASGPAFALAIDGQVDDLSGHGLFLRTPQTLPLGTSATVCLELPEDRVCLRAQVVRVVRGARSGIGVRFVAEQPSRLQVANYLMRCHAHGA